MTFEPIFKKVIMWNDTIPFTGASILSICSTAVPTLQQSQGSSELDEGQIRRFKP